MRGDGVYIFGQKPTIEEIKEYLLKLQGKLPHYGSIKTEQGSFTGEFLNIFINGTRVDITIAQDRLDAKNQPYKVNEDSSFKLEEINEVIEYPNPFQRRTP